MKIPCRSAFAAALAGLLAGNVPAYAHNERVHSGMVDLSYEIMKAVETNAPSIMLNMQPPPNLNPQQLQDWQDFLKAVASAPAKYRKHGTGLPANKDPKCGSPGIPGSSWAQANMGDIQHPVDPYYNRATSGVCGVWMGFTPGGVFDQVNNSRLAPTDYTGTVLGFWAANVDAGFDDTHLWWRPQNVAGAGAAKSFINDAVNIGIAILLAPFICLGELFAGNPGACWADAKDAGDTLNPIDEIDGFIPGIGDISGSDWVGVWHHIQVIGGGENDYDDIQGLLLSHAGPFDTLDKVDLGLMVGMDVGGISLNGDDSLGTQRYESKGGDGSPATIHRTRSQWQFTTWPHSAFEPVDNLGQYGWNAFHGLPGHPVEQLGYPLHALGDATVPMHVAGTPSWGHRPFEDAAELIWSDLRLEKAPTASQVAMVRNILIEAFQFHQMIRQWRSGQADQTQIPIRKLITAVATHTAGYSQQTQAAQNWPFDGDVSLNYFLGDGAKQGTIDHYAYFPNAVDLYNPIFVNGAGAMVAFLTAASEVL